MPATDPPFDVWLLELQSLYPVQAVSRSHLTVTAFVDALRGDAFGPYDAWHRMKVNLATQIRGHQWRVKGMIPRLDRWLRDGLWLQQHDEHPVSALVSEKTARTLSSAQAFVEDGKRGA